MTQQLGVQVLLLVVVGGRWCSGHTMWQLLSVAKVRQCPANTGLLRCILQSSAAAVL
jgi:hypothetical protein